MTNNMIRIGLASLGVLLLAAPLCAEEQQLLKSRTDRDSYSTGVEVVRSLKQQGGQIDLDLVIKGMKDGLTGEKMLMTEDELRKILAARESEAAKKREQAARQRDDTQSTTANAGPSSESPVPLKPDRPVRPDDQGDASLAKMQTGAFVSPMQATAGVSGNSGNGQMQMRPEQPGGQVNQTAPNGSILSRRNQAKLSVAEMKRELRATTISRETGQ